MLLLMPCSAGGATNARDDEAHAHGDATPACTKKGTEKGTEKGTKKGSGTGNSGASTVLPEASLDGAVAIPRQGTKELDQTIGEMLAANVEFVEDAKQQAHHSQANTGLCRRSVAVVCVCHLLQLTGTLAVFVASSV